MRCSTSGSDDEISVPFRESSADVGYPANVSVVLGLVLACRVDFFSVLETWSGESPRRTWRQHVRTCPRGNFWERAGYTKDFVAQVINC